MWIPIRLNPIFEFYVQCLYFPRDKHTQTQITVFFPRSFLPSLTNNAALAQGQRWLSRLLESQPSSFPATSRQGRGHKRPAVTLAGSNNQTSSDTWRGPSRSSSHIWDCWLSVIQTHPCNNLNAVITPRVPMAWPRLERRRLGRNLLNCLLTGVCSFLYVMFGKLFKEGVEI